MIIKIIQKIISWIKDHTKAVILAALGTFIPAAADGYYNKRKAKRTNDRALEIQQEALKLHDTEHQKAQQVLSALGEIESQVAESFTRFSDAIERIQERPAINVNRLSPVSIHTYDLHEIRTLSLDFQMAIAGVGGAGVGAMAGLAAFGVGALLAAPALVSGGIVLCVKGRSLKNQAIENEKQAIELRKSVDEIVAYYAALGAAAESFRKSILAVYEKYSENLLWLEATVAEKTRWKDYNRRERKRVENTVLLAGLLCKMLKTKIVEKATDENLIETVNKKELMDLQKEAGKLLKEVS